MKPCFARAEDSLARLRRRAPQSSHQMPSARAPKRKTRILIADREGVFRLGLRKLFAVEDDLRVVGQADDAAGALLLAKAFRPDVVFVEAKIVGEEAADFFTRVRRVSPRVKIVVTGSELSEDEAARYVKAGASGVILKSVDPALFVKCVRKVMANELWLPKRPVARKAQLLATADQQPRPVETLTPREKTVISYLMQGWRNREIARHLSITEQTVKNHLRAIYDKVGVSDRLELVLYAIHHRLKLPPAQLAAG